MASYLSLSKLASLIIASSLSTELLDEETTKESTYNKCKFTLSFLGKIISREFSNVVNAIYHLHSGNMTIRLILIEFKGYELLETYSKNVRKNNKIT